jgi:2-phosphoglycerate kinase
MVTRQLSWTALLIGGPSGSGKSTVAKHIARHFGASWLHVDDLRLALQWSHASLSTPEETAALYFFEETPDVLRLPAERLRDGLIGVGRALSPALEKVIDNHITIAEPVVIEGDAILPSLFTRPRLRAHVTGGHMQAIFVVEPEESAILANLLDRGRGIAGYTDAELRTRARAYWLYGHWLAGEARRRGGLPVQEPQPWSTLADRTVDAIGTMRRL